MLSSIMNRQRLYVLGGLVVLVLCLAAVLPSSAGGGDGFLYYGVPSRSAGCFPPTICIDWYFTFTDQYHGSCCVNEEVPPGGRIYSNDPEMQCVRGTIAPTP